MPKPSHRLKPTALSPCWAPKRWPDPPGPRWLLLLVPCWGETKQPQQQAEPGPQPRSEHRARAAPGDTLPCIQEPRVPKSSSWGSSERLWDHTACGGTRAAPNPGCAGLPPPHGSQGHLHPGVPPLSSWGQPEDPFLSPGGLELLQPGLCPTWGSWGRAGAQLRDREREKNGIKNHSPVESRRQPKQMSFLHRKVTPGHGPL